MKMLMPFIFLNLSFVSFAKEPSSTKYDWKKDLVDVEYHLSDNYVENKKILSNLGIATYLPVYNSWSNWTNRLREIVSTSTPMHFEEGVEELIEVREEYRPYEKLNNELSSFSTYLSEIRKLCGRYPTKDELVELSKGPVHSLKCSATLKINGKELHELKHWAEALSDPELRVFSHTDSKREYFHVVLRLPPLIQSDRTSDYEYAPLLDNTYVFNSSFPEMPQNQTVYWRTLDNQLRRCGDEFYFSMLTKNIKDKTGFCFYDGKVIYPFEKLFKTKDIFLKKNKDFNFEHLVDGPAPHIYFRNYYKKKHGDPNVKRVKKK